MIELYKLPYILMLRVMSPSPSDCHKYFDKYHRREFDLCFKDLFVRVGGDVFIPRVFFMYKLDRDYRLRKGYSYYHKEAPFHSFNDTTLFKMLKFLKSKRVKFEYWFEFSRDDSVSSLTLGYWDYLLGEVCGGVRTGEYSADEQLYGIGKILAENNTIVGGMAKIPVFEKTYILKGNCDEFEEGGERGIKRHVKFSTSIHSVLMFPTSVELFKKYGFTGVVVKGYGNSGVNSYIVGDRVRLDYHFGEVEAGFLFNESSILIPEKHYKVSSVVNGLKVWRSLFLYDVLRGVLWMYDGKTLRQVSNDDIVAILRPTHAHREYYPPSLSVKFEKRVYLMKSYTYPLVTFKKMHLEVANELKNNLGRVDIVWSDERVLDYIREECKGYFNK